MVRYDGIYKFNEIYFMEQLLQENESIERHIKRLEESLKEMQKKQLKLYEISKELLIKEYDHYIKIDRYERNCITYEVRYLKVVKGESPNQYKNNTQVMEFYKFSGKERREAIKLAEGLAKEYRCKLVKNF